MFCTECGRELPDDACFCTYCGNQTSNYIQENNEIQQTDIAPQSNYATQQSVYAYDYTMPLNIENSKKKEPILSDRESGIIIATGFVYIIVGIVTAIIIAANAGSFASLSQTEDMKHILETSAFLGVCIDLFFGIGIIMKKRWAALTTRVFMIMGAVYIIVIMIHLLIQIEEIKEIPSAIAMYKIDYSPVFVLLLNIAYNITMIVLTSIIANALSQETQYYRRKYQEKGHSVLSSKADDRDFWVCKKCGSHNNISSSFCKDCGNYK